MKIKPASIGSTSHGTLRTKDLLHTFASELESLILLNGEHFSRPENFDERDKLNNLVGEAQDAFGDDAVNLAKDEDVCAEIVNDLQNALEQFAPPYCYFGAHCGDGSDFGFWPSHDSIEELPHVSDLDEAKELGEDCKFVNDHGNVTVYGGDGSVLLEIV